MRSRQGSKLLWTRKTADTTLALVALNGPAGAVPFAGSVTNKTIEAEDLSRRRSEPPLRGQRLTHAPQKTLVAICRPGEIGRLLADRRLTV